VTGFQCLETKSGKTGDKMTLNEIILSFKVEVQKKDGSTGKMQVFKAIDQNKQGEGYIFTFYPDIKETFSTGRPEARGFGQVVLCTRRNPKRPKFSVESERKECGICR
jgi:hypothetical protein